LIQTIYNGGIILRLYIIRHADPDYPNNTITAAGHLEAQALAKRLKKEGLDRIFVSPLPRAIHTMQYTAEALNLKAATLEWTKELDALRFKGSTPWPITCAWDIPAEVILDRNPLPSHKDWHTIPELKEFSAKKLFDELIAHSDQFLKTLGFERYGTKYKILRPSKEKVAVFCHGGFGLTWLAHLLNIPLTIMWSSFWLSPSSVTTILFDQRSPEWAVPRCISLADTSHLYEAGLAVRPRGIKANFE
jgi:probable phosphoglycerate mutase